jgi:hypothetical protein
VEPDLGVLRMEPQAAGGTGTGAYRRAMSFSISSITRFIF